MNYPTRCWNWALPLVIFAVRPSFAPAVCIEPNQNLERSTIEALKSVVPDLGHKNTFGDDDLTIYRLFGSDQLQQYLVLDRRGCEGLQCQTVVVQLPSKKRFDVSAVAPREDFTFTCVEALDLKSLKIDDVSYSLCGSNPRRLTAISFVPSSECLGEK